MNEDQLEQVEAIAPESNSELDCIWVHFDRMKGATLTPIEKLSDLELYKAGRLDGYYLGSLQCRHPKYLEGWDLQQELSAKYRRE